MVAINETEIQSSWRFMLNCVCILKLNCGRSNRWFISHSAGLTYTAGQDIPDNKKLFGTTRFPIKGCPRRSLKSAKFHSISIYYLASCIAKTTSGQNRTTWIQWSGCLSRNWHNLIIIIPAMCSQQSQICGGRNRLHWTVLAPMSEIFRQKYPRHALILTVVNVNHRWNYCMDEYLHLI